MDEETVRYFKELVQEVGVPYQTLINLYLRDCAASHKKLSLQGKRMRVRTNEGQVYNVRLFLKERRKGAGL